MRKFRYWIVWFLIALCVIPICISFGLIGIAKVIGVLTVVTLVVALRVWLHRTKQEFNPIEQVKINTNDRFELNRAFTCYKGLTETQRSVFDSRLGLFLAKTAIYTQDDLSRVDYIIVAAHAISSTWDEFSEEFHMNTSRFSVEKQDGGRYVVARLSATLSPESTITVTVPCIAPLLELSINKNFWKI